MNDVARLAGVSLATVSRVVNDSGEVRPELAARVRDAVGVLGYRRDLMASNLRRSDRASRDDRTDHRGHREPVLLGRPSWGRGRRPRTHGVLTFAGSSDEVPERERELADAFGARGVDGLVIVPCGRDQGYLQREQQLGTQLVFVDRPARFIDADAVVTDERRRCADRRRASDLGGTSPDRASWPTGRPSSPPQSDATDTCAALQGAGIAADPALAAGRARRRARPRPPRRASC